MLQNRVNTCKNLTLFFHFIETEERVLFYCSTVHEDLWGKKHEALSGQTANLSILGLILLLCLESGSSHCDFYSALNIQCIKQKRNQRYSEETGRVNVSEGPLIFNRYDQMALNSAAQGRSQEQKEPSCASTCAVARTKGRTIWVGNKNTSTTDFLSALGNNWEWSQGSSTGLLPVVFRESDVI